MLVSLDYHVFVSKHKLIQSDELVKAIADTAILLEPLNAYLYTWNLLNTLEVEEINLFIRKTLKMYARVSIWIVPLLYLVFTLGATFADLKFNSAILNIDVNMISYWQRVRFI